MIRVINHGKKFERGPLKCSACGCEFMYSDETGWEKTRAMVVRCPKCEHQIELKEYKI